MRCGVRDRPPTSHPLRRRYQRGSAADRGDQQLEPLIVPCVQGIERVDRRWSADVGPGVPWLPWRRARRSGRCDRRRSPRRRASEPIDRRRGARWGAGRRRIVVRPTPSALSPIAGRHHVLSLPTGASEAPIFRRYSGVGSSKAASPKSPDTTTTDDIDRRFTTRWQRSDVECVPDNSGVPPPGRQRVGGHQRSVGQSCRGEMPAAHTEQPLVTSAGLRQGAHELSSTRRQLREADRARQTMSDHLHRRPCLPTEAAAHRSSACLRPCPMSSRAMAVRPRPSARRPGRWCAACG